MINARAPRWLQKAIPKPLLLLLLSPCALLLYLAMYIAYYLPGGSGPHVLSRPDALGGESTFTKTKNGLLGFAGQRPYITPPLAVRGPFCTPGVLFGVARPSKPRRKGGRRISGHPAGYPRGTVGTGGECWLGLRHPSPAPPAAENGLWIPRGGCHGILKGWGALGPDIEKVALGDGSSLSQKAPQSTELTAQWLKLQGERKGNAS